MILDGEQANDPEMVQRLVGADVIYFTGGNPNHLLETLEDSRLLAAILEAVAGGAILAGSSAGAMVMGSVMRRPRADEWVTGLGIAEGICVLPHHERSNPDQVMEQIQERLSDSLTILGNRRANRLPGERRGLAGNRPRQGYGVPTGRVGAVPGRGVVQGRLKTLRNL